MCNLWVCKCCRLRQRTICGDYVEGKPCANKTYTGPSSSPSRCDTCTCIRAVIHELQCLVFREPWLLTEGVGGAPEKAAWECEGLEHKKGISQEEDYEEESWDWDQQEYEEHEWQWDDQIHEEDSWQKLQQSDEGRGWDEQENTIMEKSEGRREAARLRS